MLSSLSADYPPWTVACLRAGRVFGLRALPARACCSGKPPPIRPMQEEGPLSRAPNRPACASHAHMCGVASEDRAANAHADLQVLRRMWAFHGVLRHRWRSSCLNASICDEIDTCWCPLTLSYSDRVFSRQVGRMSWSPRGEDHQLHSTHGPSLPHFRPE